MTSPLSSPSTPSNVANTSVDLASHDDFISATKGYEYVQPSISALLLTEPSQNSASKNNDTGIRQSENKQHGEDNDRFGVDSKSFTLQLNHCHDPDIVSIQELANLAEKCDKILFKRDNSLIGNQSNGDKYISGLPDKILGLICLSQLHSCYLLRRNDSYRDSITDQTDLPEGDIGTERDPGILLATMVALNLLETSIRNTIKRGDENASIKYQSVDSNERSARIVGKYEKHLDTPSKIGAPLLKNMIEQLSSLGNLTDVDVDRNKKRKSDESLNSIHIVPPSSLAPILRALLLPTRSASKYALQSTSMHNNNLGMHLVHNLTEDVEITGGLNLRNLISHGFLSTVERRWFSLCVVLIQTLESSFQRDGHTTQKSSVNEFDQGRGECNSTRGGLHSLSSLTKYKPMAFQVKLGQDILLGNEFQDRMRKLEIQSCRRQINEFPSGGCEVKHLVPDSHRCFLKFVLFGLAPSLRGGTKSSDDTGTKENPSLPLLPTIFITALSSIIEHSLRLLWCYENQRHYHCIARASEYYVTLDGHGQRDRHDVMISPFLIDGTSKNKLISLIGAPAFAMLSDLFASPSPDAPNIRSAVCHGTLDDAVVAELEELGQWAIVLNGCLNTNQTKQAHTDNNEPFLIDASCALISCLDLISSGVSGQPNMSRYEPVYSYTAMAKRDLGDILSKIDEIDSLISKNTHILNCVESMEEQQSKLCKDMGLLRVDTKALTDMVYRVFPTMVKDPIDDIWTIEDVFVEHGSNIVLTNGIAAQKLLSDISREAKAYLTAIRDGMNTLTITPTCTKDKRAVKSMTRFCGISKMTVDFYSFSVYIALLMIMVVHRDTLAVKSSSVVKGDVMILDLHRDDVVKAVERTRMTLSTYCSFIATNLDRSTKAMQQYLQGKAIKNVIDKKKYIQQHRIS